jgi:hypothetical protein
MVDRAFQRFLRLRRGVDRENGSGGSFRTAHTPPRRAAAIGIWPEPGAAPARTVVMMRGPISTDHGFTLETLRFYSWLKLGAHLGVSTSVGADTVLAAPTTYLGATRILSEEPAFAPVFNAHMQTNSAAAEIRRTVTDGAQGVKKSRTNQRLSVAG